MTRIGAVILAAGFGTRLAPLTDTTPKPLIEVGGEPVASHLLHRLREVELVDHVVVVANGRHGEAWQRWHDSLAPAPTVQLISNGITANEERAGAVSDLALAVRSLDGCDWIIVLAGDNLIDEPLQPHVDSALDTDRPVVLCRDLGDAVPPGRFGEITIDADGVITRFREKPDDPTSPYAATCSYVLPGMIGRELATYLQTGNADSPGEFVGWLASQRVVMARTLTGQYFDIGNHETLAQARQTYRSHVTRPETT